VIDALANLAASPELANFLLASVAGGVGWMVRKVWSMSERLSALESLVREHVTKAKD
jgi:hypothetical protein